MEIVHSTTARGVERSEKVARLLETISERQLRAWVERISVPRHSGSETQANRDVANWLAQLFEGMGFQVERQGPYANIIATPEGAIHDAILVGAHYDSVPMSPGADDNGSAVAAMLGCAAACSLWRPEPPIVFVAFNCEEDGLRGSRDFVESYLPEAKWSVQGAHILEMVGFASSKPGSQRVPSGLPISISDTGDFLGLLANNISETT